MEERLTAEIVLEQNYLGLKLCRPGFEELKVLSPRSPPNLIDKHFRCQFELAPLP